MIRRAYLPVLALGVSCLALVACETTPVAEPVVEAVAVEEVVAPVELSDYDRALQTANDLVASGNTQTAIDRLTQLLGTSGITDDQRAEALSMRGDLRYSDDGYDVWGAIADFEMVIDAYPDSPVTPETTAMLGIARGEATSLSSLLRQPETSRTQRFQSLLRLGRHDDALDLMLSSNLQPKNEELIAMFQIGYLCVGDEQTGPIYTAEEANGDPLELRFCDFGK
ncbi:MAG: hypothetical protein ABJG15_12860 [Hyphomonadaceae bacterium]